MCTLILSALLAGIALAQQQGTYTPEVHPQLLSQNCTSAGCRTLNTSVVLDSNYRWLHNVGGYDSCNPAGLSPDYCPNVTACATNCALEGVNYASNGVTTSGSSVTLNLFFNGTSRSPRIYLLANETTYSLFQLLNKEFTYTVDVSKVPCGVNGALYLSEMSANGGASDLNTAGAKYGTGYCDAQCPKNNFLDTPEGLEANINGTMGACCNEMDIWEANNAANALTPHPCDAVGTQACTGTACTNDLISGVCDQAGCDFNPFRMGNQAFYGPNDTVDTTKPFTVVTQFITDNNQTTGTLSAINRIYKQNNRTIQNSFVSVSGMSSTYNSISDSYCEAEAFAFDEGDDFTFKARGGMTQMGGALGRGMVLVMSIWEDSGSFMQWLDGQTGDITEPGNWRGPCSTSSGQPDEILADYPDAAVTFSNIKIGDLGTTF